MNTKAFTKNASGKIIRAPQGYDYFFPDPLPPQMQISKMDYIRLISDAGEAIGKLAGLGYTIPNPNLLVIPYTRLEAVASSRIEGTQASLSELFYFEAASQNPRKTEDLIEVKNYLNTLNYGIERLKTLPLSLRLLRELHQRLMSGVRGDAPNLTPGEFRRSQNWIGPAGASLNDARYVPPHQNDLINLLGQWESFIHTKSEIPLLIQCALMHYQFEAIHPFLDGNGRVGRLFISLFLLEKKILSQPLLYLSHFFERHRDEYYSNLLRVSTNGDWESWIRFFLQAVITQSNHAIESAKRIQDAREHYRQKLQQNRKTRSMVGLVDFIFLNPYFDIQHAAQVLNTTYNTASKGVVMIEEMGLIEEITGQSRNRIYVATELIRLLEDNKPIYKPKDQA